MMRTLKRALTWVVLGWVPAVAIAGCGSDKIELVDLKSKVVETLCDFEVRCGAFPDSASCSASLSVSNFDRIVASVNEGKTKYDGNAAADCLAALRSRLGSCSLSASAQQQQDPKACNDTFKGTQPAGAACFDDVQCLSASCNLDSCGGVPSCCMGTCNAVAATPVAIGGDCSSSATATGPECVEGAFCDFSVSPPRCQARKALGQPCTTFDECVGGALCIDALTPGTSGVCGKLPKEGEACTSQFLACDLQTDFCNASTSKCAPKIKVGGACPLGTGCIDYARCDLTTNSCVAKAAVGGPCTSPSDCFPGLDCSTAGLCAVTPDPICN